MGLDIVIVKVDGKDEDGYLKVSSPKEDLPYTTNRFAIRKEISNNVELNYIQDDEYYSLRSYCRPKDFDKAYKWANQQNENDKKYLYDLFKSLQMNDNYYLEYCY